MERWRLIKSDYDDPRINLAVEESIALSVGEGLSPPTVRFWRNPESIILGRFQKAELEVDLDKCKLEDIFVVRRFTGGGTVYHDLGNLNCAISLPDRHPLVNSSSSTFYRVLENALITGLNSLGVDASMKGNSVYISDNKFAGMAGMKKKGVVFQHCSLLIDVDTLKMKEILKFETANLDKKYVRSKKSKVINLGDYLRREIGISEVEEMLKKSLEKRWEIKLYPGEITEKEKSRRKKLFEEKYRDKYCITSPTNK